MALAVVPFDSLSLLHEPQLSVPPQPLDTLPQTGASAAQVVGVQQLPLVHTCEAPQEQLSVAPQPSDLLPHWPAKSTAQVFGAQQLPA